MRGLQRDGLGGERLVVGKKKNVKVVSGWRRVSDGVTPGLMQRHNDSETIWWQW